VRAQIDLRGSVIDIECIHPALRDGKGGRPAFAPSGLRRGRPCRFRDARRPRSSGVAFGAEGEEGP
jgi:hypothetical protein